MASPPPACQCSAGSPGSGISARMYWAASAVHCSLVIRHWRKALARRSRKGRVTWDRMKDILDRYPLPPATVVHSIYAA